MVTKACKGIIVALFSLVYQFDSSQSRQLAAGKSERMLAASVRQPQQFY